MVAFPQRGSCLCGDVAYDLLEDPLTVYVCHCTDCQRQTGSSFALTAIVTRDALKRVRGRPEEYSIELGDGRVKQASFCARCATRLWEPSRISTLAILEPGKVGLHVTAIANISLEDHHPDSVAEFDRMVAERPEILECFATSGQQDYTLKIICESIVEYDRLLNEHILSCKPVHTVSTSFVLHGTKHTTALPLPGD